MMYPFLLRRRRDAQTLVFFILAFGTIILLCGLAIDSGLLYLAKARMSRAVDGAALVAVGNFNESPLTVANSMRDFAAVNFTSLESVSSTPSSTSSNTVTTAAGTTTTLTYWYNDTTAGSDSKGYRKFVEVILTTGSGGQITAAVCNARCPAQTYFIGFAKGAFPILGDLNVSSAAQATRNPRLIMIVLDRSASMLQQPEDGGSLGAFGLPQSVITFLDFFEPGADYIGIVSFGSNARLEMPLTTNFLYAATNNLIDSYAVSSNSGYGTIDGYYSLEYGVPGIDPEMEATNADYDAGYATNGVRRMKFGGDTAADDGIRMALECMMSNSGFNNPDVVKYLVIFTDGVWNNARTLVAAPTYTNWVVYNTNSFTKPFQVVSNTAPQPTTLLANTGVNGGMVFTASDMYFLPSMSPMPFYTNALNDLTFETGLNNYSHHTNDYWVSLDTNTGGGSNPSLEPLSGSTQVNTGSGVAGAPASITTFPLVGLNSTTNVYASTINVWVQPGAIDYYYHNSSSPTAAYLGDCNNPTNTITLQMVQGDSNELVVPGYVVDGFLFDGLDLAYYDASHSDGDSTAEYWARYRADNYNQPFMWPDDQTPNPTSTIGSGYPFFWGPSPVRASVMRSLLFRNYVNMLTGFYVMRADDPMGTGVEPLTGAQRPLNGLGPYYPTAAVYWPFDLVGIGTDPSFSLTNALEDPDSTGNEYSRRNAWTINMLSTNADPEWAGELFYMGTGGTSVTSSNTAVSSVMSSAADWQIGAPTWLTSAFGTDMTNDPTSNTSISPNPKVWRPGTFRGTFIGTVSSGTNGSAVLSVVNGTTSATGGYLYDSSTGDVYKNSMCWNGRPTHYYNFATSTWQAIQDNHHTDIQAEPLGFWKAEEYAWHARAAGVTIYTVGYGAVVADSQNTILATMANATNVNLTNGTSTNISYISSQPIGQQYYADSTNAISNDFYEIGTAINAALTQ
ncbi:MAG: pilus assembly protein TadG-related protein [Methylacidiphilales bacterium]|nr:pilus assembly protein TadG-related protein [Candidatus Methylacidiphilales bacterium]